MNWPTHAQTHISWLVLGEQDTLGSPEGTDGLNSGGMITGRMEVRNQQGREESRGRGARARRNDQSLLNGKKGNIRSLQGGVIFGKKNHDQREGRKVHSQTGVTRKAKHKSQRMEEVK